MLYTTPIINLYSLNNCILKIYIILLFYIYNTLGIFIFAAFAGNINMGFFHAFAGNSHNIYNIGFLIYLFIYITLFIDLGISSLISTSTTLGISILLINSSNNILMIIFIIHIIYISIMNTLVMVYVISCNEWFLPYYQILLVHVYFDVFVNYSYLYLLITISMSSSYVSMIFVIIYSFIIYSKVISHYCFKYYCALCLLLLCFIITLKVSSIPLL